MAMNLPGGGGDEPQVMVDINTTPLIDVMLVLLIMLIITIPIQLHAVNLDMPVGKPPPVEREPEVVRIDVDAESRVHWQGEPVESPAALEALMREAAQQGEQPEIHLRPDKSAAYATVANVLAATKRSGLTRVGIVGSEQFMP